MKTSILCLSVIVALIFLSSCTGVQPEIMSETKMLSSPYVDPGTMRQDEIIHLPTGTFLTKSELFDLLADKKIIFVGEGHDNIYDHQVELEVIKTLFQRFPDRLAVGFEMLSHANQEKIDRWLQNELTEDDFIRLFAADWGVANFVYYREIFTFLKASQIPVRALNVSRSEKMEVMHAAAITEKSATVISDPYQEKALQAMFKGHTKGHGNIDIFLEVHKLWEATMARNIKDYLTSSEGADKILVVFAGGFHVAQGFGLPRRVFQLVKADYCTLLTHTPPDMVENERRTMEVDFPDLPLYLCDYLWCVPYRNLKDKQARLGVGLEKSEKGIRIVMVEAESVAAGHGLVVGDLIIAGDGKSLPDPIALSILLLRKNRGEIITLEIERNNKIHLVKILL